jgi:hypothetical protein
MAVDNQQDMWQNDLVQWGFGFSIYHASDIRISSHSSSPKLILASTGAVTRPGAATMIDDQQYLLKISKLEMDYLICIVL